MLLITINPQKRNFDPAFRFFPRSPVSRHATHVFSSIPVSLYDHINVFRFWYWVTVIIMIRSPLFIALMLAGSSKCLKQIINWIKLNRVKNSSPTSRRPQLTKWLSVQLTAVPYYLQLLPTYLPTLPALSILILDRMDIWGNSRQYHECIERNKRHYSCWCVFLQRKFPAIWVVN